MLSSFVVYSLFDIPLTFAVVSGVVVCYFMYLTLRPLLEEGDLSTEEWERMEDESIALLNKRDRIIEELRDLEFEAGMNKVEGQDLEMLRALYQNEALQVIQELDQQVGHYQDQIQAQVDARLAEVERKKEMLSSSKDAPSTSELSPEEPPEETPEDHVGEVSEGSPNETSSEESGKDQNETQDEA